MSAVAAARRFAMLLSPPALQRTMTQRLPHAHEQQMITLREAEGDGGLLPPEPVKIIICHAAMHAAPNLHPARKSLLLLEPQYTTSVASLRQQSGVLKAMPQHVEARTTHSTPRAPR